MQKRIDGIMESQNLSEQSAKAEIVANSCMTVFDENFITNFAKAHTKEARIIKDWFNRLVARIRQAMDKVKKYVSEYRAISDDVAEVERIRDLFNAALGERNANVKQNNAKSVNDNKLNFKYSIKSDNKGKYVEIELNKLFDNNDNISIINKFMKTNFKGKVYPLSDNSKVYIGAKGINEYTHPARKNIDKKVFQDKLYAGTELDKLLQISEFVNHLDDDGHHPDAVGGWDNYKVTYKVKDTFYQGYVRIENRFNGREFKDITKIKEITRNASQSAEALADANNLSSKSISKNLDNVKYSVKNSDIDSEYENATEQKKEKIIQDLAMEWGAYSIDGKTPLKLYHGTQSFGFTEFDLNKMDDERSIFLTDDITMAKTYSGVYDAKKISESKLSNYNNLSEKEIANALSKYNNETSQYKYYTKDDVNQMIRRCKSND